MISSIKHAFCFRIASHFDGKVLVPDEAVELPVGLPLRLHIELSSSASSRFVEYSTTRRESSHNRWGFVTFPNTQRLPMYPGTAAARLRPVAG